MFNATGKDRSSAAANSVEQPQQVPQSVQGVKGLRARFIWLFPVVFITYSLAYLDRANFGFGAAAGMNATLGISDKQVSLLSSLFFLGYFIFQLPGAALARTVGVRRLVTVLLVGWAPAQR